MKILDAIWFNEMGIYRPIGIVFGIDEITKEEKAYIGTADGDDEESDKKHIASYGSKFPIACAKLLLGRE